MYLNLAAELTRNIVFMFQRETTTSHIEIIQRDFSDLAFRFFRYSPTNAREIIASPYYSASTPHHDEYRFWTQSILLPPVLWIAYEKLSFSSRNQRH
jgi:hypothetical protein